MDYDSLRGRHSQCKKFGYGEKERKVKRAKQESRLKIGRVSLTELWTVFYCGLVFYCKRKRGEFLSFSETGSHSMLTSSRTNWSVCNLETFECKDSAVLLTHILKY